MLHVDHDDGSDLVDEDGRPVGEIGARWWSSAETELVACPYADARHGRPMNQSALRQLGRVWDEVRTTVAAMSAVASEPGTVAGAWQTALAGTAIPTSFASERPGVRVPRALSALCKTSLGFSQLLTALLLSADGVADQRLADLGTSRDFLGLLDREGWLVGDEQVCAGPRDWIGAMFDAFANPLAGELPHDVRTLGRRRATWVGLQVAWIGAARAKGTVEPRLPYLRAVQVQPGRRAHHARRLFVDGDVPDAVEAFLSRLVAEPEADFARLSTMRDEAVAPWADA